MISNHNCRCCYLYGKVVYNLRYHQVVSPRSSQSTDYVDTASGEIVAVPFRIIILHASRFYITQTSFTVSVTMVFYVSLHVTVRLTGECKPRGVRIPDNVTFLVSIPIYIYARATCSIIRIRLKTSKATIVSQPEFYSPTTIKIETISRWANGLVTSVTAVNISVSLNMMCARCTLN